MPFKKYPPTEDDSEPTTGPTFGMLELLSARPTTAAEVRAGTPGSRCSIGDPPSVRRSAPPLASLLSDIRRDLRACRARSSLPSSNESFGVIGEVPNPSVSARLRAGWFDWADFEVDVLPPVMNACDQRRWFAVTFKCSRCGENGLMSGSPNARTFRQWADGVPTLPIIQSASTFRSLPPYDDDM